jgi:eukaryotic-like serine/threonine-protein kinase
VDSIGRYRLERRIGAGSFATVWLGHDDDLDVPVAVKVLAENWADNEDVRNRFLAEARILRRIRDPRLVQVYDIGTVDDGRPYFVMDYISGGSFDDLRKAGCEPVRGLRLAAEACRAIEVLHANDIIHRDVTPGNLLLSTGRDGQTRVLIADLGVAKSMVDSVGATMTAGTPSYMAPEQAAGVLPLDRRADIYSLTAVTYALLTGSAPFVTRSIADILARDPDLKPEPVAQRLGAPPSLDGVLVAGLAADRNRRPPTALLLADALETIARQMEQGRPKAPAEAGPTDQPAESTVVTNPNRPAVPAVPAAPTTPASAPPVPASLPPVTAATPPSMIQPDADYVPEAQPEYGGSVPPSYPVDPYAAPQPATTTVAQQPRRAPRRSASYYILLALAALALFALSMFVTILILR